MEILKTQNVSKTFGTEENPVKALCDVSLSINKSEMLAIIGPSGCGKSTLLHVLGGIEAPTTGIVSILGEDLYQMNDSKMTTFRRNNIGMIYQFFNLLPVLSVEENIVLPLLLAKKKPAFPLDELLKDMGLDERKTFLPSQLSGGQQQRVAIGRALISKPAILLADEPTGNLDSKTGEDIVALLIKANQEYHQTLIIVTHDERVANHCSRIIRMEDGRIVSQEGGQ
ncbi:MAG: ABC transporter ATP-binding protein [Lachnospiraceae bacterium]|nr:ABC transporter ATP-binding protein [Lachnospiraceae bacterium]